MDIIYLRDLRVDAVIGVHAWEQRIRQRLRIDLEMGVDLRTAAASDTLDASVDYAAVAERVTELAQTSHCKLVETLAERIAALLTGELTIPWVKVTVAKPGAVPSTREVGVVIERGQPS